MLTLGQQAQYCHVMHPLAYDEFLEIQLSIHSLICLVQLGFIRLSTFGPADPIEEAAHAFDSFATLEIQCKARQIVGLRRLRGVSRWITGMIREIFLSEKSLR